MAKKISEKITNEHKFTIEGILNVDDLQENTLIVEVEEVGEVDLFKHIKKFADKNIKITLGNKTEETVEV